MTNITVKTMFGKVPYFFRQDGRSHVYDAVDSFWKDCTEYAMDFESAYQYLAKKSFRHYYKSDFQRLGVLLDWKEDESCNYEWKDLFRLKAADGYRYFVVYSNQKFSMPWLDVVCMIHTDLEDTAVAFDFCYLHMEDTTMQVIAPMRIEVAGELLSLSDFIDIAEQNSCSFKKFYKQDSDILNETIQYYKLINY